LNARENRNVFSLDLNVPKESLSVTVLGLGVVGYSAAGGGATEVGERTAE